MGDAYIEGNGQEQFQKSIRNTSYNYDAPIYANNKMKNSQIDTFNPDKFISSNEDKNLYKPFKNEDIQ